MTRKQLEDLGLTKEQADSIIKINGDDIENAKSASAAEIKNLQTEVDGLKTQVGDRDKQLKTLKASAGDNADLKKQIETLQQQNADQKKAHAEEMAQLKLDNAISSALTTAGAKNPKAVMALIDKAKVKLGDDGKLTGWDEQLTAVQKSDAYLFESKQPSKPTFRGFQPGTSGEVKPGTKVDLSKMSYEELANYIENNPDAE